MLVDLEALAATARQKAGRQDQATSTRSGNMPRPSGWAEVRPSPGDAPVSVLRPAEASAAHPRSLSAPYGLGQQPLHTDGAHLPDPPDIVVLISSHPEPDADAGCGTARRAKAGRPSRLATAFATGCSWCTAAATASTRRVSLARATGMTQDA